MLTSSRKPISDFSSAAGDVRLQIASTRAFGEPTGPVTAVERQALSTIRDLVNLGSRFGHGPDGNLDVTGSTPEQIDLFVELENLLPGQLDVVRGEDEKVDVREWAKIATEILKCFEAAVAWQKLQPQQRKFIDFELEPFLVKLIDVPAEDDEE